MHIGARVRLRRTTLGLSQGKLGEAIGVTFQQVQKYERGTNRIGAPRLVEIARVLHVPVSFFFENTDAGQTPAAPTGLEPGGRLPEGDPFQRPETLALINAFYEIPSVKLRKCFLELAKALAGEGRERTGGSPSTRAGAGGRQRRTRRTPC